MSEICSGCDGVGWVEGGAALQMTCEACGGKGELPGRLFIVAVFEHARDGGRKPLLTAYTRDYNPSWPGCCLHIVRAENGTLAKREAIACHKQGIGCRGPVMPASRGPRFRI